MSGDETLEMFVINRKGIKEDVRFDLITERNKEIAKKLNLSIQNDISRLSKIVIGGLKSGMTTSEIDDLSCETGMAFSTEEPEYAQLVAHIAVSNLHKQTPWNSYLVCTKKLYEYTDKNGNKKSLIDPELYKFVSLPNVSERLEKAIDYTRDYKYDYFGFKTLKDSYLLPFKNKITIERPQDMLMRISVGLNVYSPDPIDVKLNNIIETYNAFSLHYYTHGSPTLWNCGTLYPQMASCFLSIIPDSIDGYGHYSVYEKLASISKRGGGIGVDVTPVRAKGSLIRSTDGSASGIIPVIRELEILAQKVSQGRRKGSIAIYLQPWHPEIRDFLQVRLPTGNENMRARDIFTALWTCDLFMERVKNNQLWSLFCPDRCPDLLTTYGEEFNKKYLEYEEKKMYVEQVPANEIFILLQQSKKKTGTPYELNKDEINRKSNQKNIGMINSSNLCAEIVEYTDKDNIAVCNLASIALPRFVKGSGVEGSGVEKYFDFEEFGRIVGLAVENCNRVIDTNLYPVKETKNANLSQRAIGVGVQGLTDVFSMLEIPWDDEKGNINPKAKKLNIQIFSAMYYYALKKSNELAKVHGPYEHFKGSPASKGILQFHMWNTEPDYEMICKKKWDNLISNIVQYGLRNSLMLACMPTATTSQILGNSESIEPPTSMAYARGTLSGNHLIFYKYLYQILKKRGLWSRDLALKIRENRGSIQNIKNIPIDIQRIFKIVWEIKQKILMEMSADRAPFIDQTQSLNLYIRNPTLQILSSISMYGWEKKLKTISYYIRSDSALDNNMFSIQKDSVGEKMEASKKKEFKCDGDVCTSCSS